jgi:predicted nucleotidyltransferase
MRSNLPALARDLGADDRTLRRAAARGAVRCRRPGPRRLELDEGELEYLASHWDVMARLTEALRTERNVRLAVMFGSVARGDETDESDLDLLVDLRDESLESRGRLRRRLRDAGGRNVQLVTVAAASTSPLLMADIVEDGRVLVDRANAWPRWRERQSRLRTEADRTQSEAEERARAVFAYYGRARQ